MPKRTQLTEAEREQRRAADRAFVQQAVEQLRSSEGWQRWLTTRRHFHTYSLRNQLLLAMQKLVSHCLLERDDCSVIPVENVRWRCSANHGSGRLPDDRLLAAVGPDVTQRHGT